MRPFPEHLLDPALMAEHFLALADTGGRFAVSSPAVGQPDLWIHAANGITYRVHGHAAKWMIDNHYIATFILNSTVIVRRKAKKLQNS